MIEFHLDARSGVAPYLQIVAQVRNALLLGLLSEGDQLPTVKEVVAKVAINPNTVSKAYRELEHLGLAAAKPGVGTFITRTLGQASLAEHGPLQDDQVVADAFEVGDQVRREGDAGLVLGDRLHEVA